MLFIRVCNGRMPLRCEAKAALLQPPEGGLQFNDPGALTTSPFTLSGAPTTNRPEGVKGLSEFRRKPNATNNFALSDLYFDRRNYYEIYLDTENILEGNSNTTLRYEGVTFTLMFGALHRGIWDTGRAEFSLFFTSSANHFFHICIPVEYTATMERQNPFLAAWLTNGNIPSGFTINDIFGMGANVEMGILNYCLDYNKGRNSATYTLVSLKTPARIASTNLPQWLKVDPTFTKASPIPGENDTSQRYRRTTFDQILNYMMRGTIRKWVADKPDPYLVSEDIYFDGAQQQNVIRPLYVRIPSEALTNRREKPVEGFANSPTQRDIKCYPIDLQTDIQDGKVQVDAQGRAIPFDEIKQSSLIGKIFDAQSTELLNSIRYYVVALIVFIVLGIFLVGITFWLFRSRSTIDVIEVPAAPVTSPADIIPKLQELINQASGKNANTLLADLQKLVPTTPK